MTIAERALLHRIPWTLLLCLLCLFPLGCYRWASAPEGVTLRLVDLPVDGLLQRYTALLPAAPSPGGRPAVIVLHSGFAGDEQASADVARDLARRGMAVVLPAYRGQQRKADGKRSDGSIEFCRGEVNDAQAAFDWLAQQDGVDRQRIGALGMSHGGCIALRLGQRDVGLRALVTLSAPVAAKPLIEHLESNRFQMFFYNGILANQLRGYTKSPAAEQQAALVERSPLQSAASLRMPMLVMHGTEDQMVPVDHACRLRAALREQGRPVRDFRIDRSGQLTSASRIPCSQPVQEAPIDSQAAIVQVVFLDRQDHLYASAVKKAAHRLAVEFLSRELASQSTPHQNNE